MYNIKKQRKDEETKLESLSRHKNFLELNLTILLSQSNQQQNQQVSKLQNSKAKIKIGPNHVKLDLRMFYEKKSLFNSLFSSESFEFHLLLNKCLFMALCSGKIGVWGTSKRCRIHSTRIYVKKAFISQFLESQMHVHSLGMCAHFLSMHTHGLSVHALMRVCIRTLRVSCSLSFLNISLFFQK